MTERNITTVSGLETGLMLKDNLLDIPNRFPALGLPILWPQGRLSRAGASAGWVQYL